jgi:hypothetical protein
MTVAIVAARNPPPLATSVSTGTLMARATHPLIPKNARFLLKKSSSFHRFVRRERPASGSLLANRHSLAFLYFNRGDGTGAGNPTIRRARRWRTSGKRFGSAIRVLDKQLQDTIYQFDHKQGVVQKIDEDSTQLADVLKARTPIVITTLQKFPFVTGNVSDLPGKRFAVIIDEDHSRQSGEAATEFRACLRQGTSRNGRRKKPRPVSWPSIGLRR